MKILAALFDGWASLCIQAWRAFLVFGGLVVVAAVVLWRKGEYDGLSSAEIADDVMVGLALMFVASFITSIIYHASVWRRQNRRWPGGGGRRGPEQ